MGRRNLENSWGENRPITVRLGRVERGALRTLAETWGVPPSEAIRRALREAAARVEPPPVPVDVPAPEAHPAARGRRRSPSRA